MPLPTFEKGDTGGPACQTSLNGLKSRARELGDTCPPNFLEGHRFVCALIFE